MQVNQEKNTNRKYYRIELPASVRIGDKTYEVKDWSLGGFMIINMQDIFSKDWEGDVKLMLPFDGVEISVDTRAKAAWVREDRAGFYFVELSSRAKSILKTYLNASIEGNLGEIDGVLAQVEAPEIPLPVEIPMTPQEEVVYKNKFYKRSMVYWAAGLALLGIIAVVVFYSMTTAISVRAVVSVPKIGVDAPYTGTLTELRVQPGDSVKKGQILAGLDDQEIQRSVETQRRRIEVSQRELEEAEAWLNLVQQGKRMYSQHTIYADVAVFQARVAIQTAQIRVEEARLRELLLTLEASKLLSPCDGEIYVVKQLEGADVHQGDELIVIRPAADKNIYVLARFTYQEAKGLAPGNVADVFVPAFGKHVKGVIQTVGHQALSGAMSSAPSLEVNMTEVPVNIVLEVTDLPMANGMVADVKIRTSILAKLGLFL